MSNRRNKKQKYKPYNLEAYPSDGKYGTRQVIITGDRLLFNAKSDSAFITGQESIGLSTNGNIHLDTLYEKDKKIILSSPTIVLGLTSEFREPSDYAVKGIQLTNELSKLVDILKEIILDISELDYKTGNGHDVDAQDLEPILSHLDTLDKWEERMKNGTFLSPRVKIS